MKALLKFVCLFLFVSAIAMPAHAAAGNWQSDDALSVRLISAVDGTGDLATITLGLEVKLSPDFHTYWRSPGEAGLPPQFNWQKSETDEGNLKSATLFYPAPTRYNAFGLETVGYRTHVVFPIEAELRKKGAALAIDTTLDILVCSQICLPKHFNLQLIVPKGPAAESAEASILREAKDQVPSSDPKAGLSLKSFSAASNEIKLSIASTVPLQNPDVFVENDKYIDFSGPLVTMSADHLSADVTLKTVMPLPADTDLSDLAFTITVVDGDRAFEVKPTHSGAPALPPAVLLDQQVSASESAPPLPAPQSFGLIFLFALLGGFILNLMPCVLPVLSLKILSVISHGGGSEKLVRQSFLMTAAGILFSFIVLAIVTILLKEGGLAVGWGVQYQQPLFLGGLVFLLTFFAANMWGLFEIKLPRLLADSLTGPYHPKLAGDFASGAFATLLATPCSAPFLGTAVGFALASGAFHILIIFAGLGLGMSLPYLGVAFYPKSATILPRPGKWMIYLRYLLATALALTACWLIWVLYAQISKTATLTVALSMVAIILILILNNINPRRYARWGVICFALVAFSALLAASLSPKNRAQIDPDWLPFDEHVLEDDIKAGKTVFVDVSAAWCVTCKANQRFVLSQPEIGDRLFSSGVVPMMADWTNPDPAISAFLQKYNRFGIPFNIVYGPLAPEGIVLPELLTKERVLKALDAASKPPLP